MKAGLFAPAAQPYGADEFFSTRGQHSNQNRERRKHRSDATSSRARDVDLALSCEGGDTNPDA